MYSEVKFYDDFYKLKLMNRLKFVLTIWNKGSFKKNLENILQIESGESIESFATVLKKSDFLSIDSSKSDDFYYISDENFKNIFNHISKSAKIPESDEIYDLVNNFRTEISPKLVEEIPLKLTNDAFFEKENLIAFLETSIAFFFLYIMGFNNEFKKNETFNEFYTNVLLALLKYNTRIYTSDPSDSAKLNKAKREFLRESVRVQLSWRM